MIECGLFIEALDSIRSAVFPGLLPPAQCLVSLLEYAQQVGPELPDCINSHLLLHEPQGLFESLTCSIRFLEFIYSLLVNSTVNSCNIWKYSDHSECFLFVMSQGNATTVFLRNLQHVMHSLLITNPPWLAPQSVKKYFSNVLQCPRCKTGLWPFLQTAIRWASKLVKFLENLFPSVFVSSSFLRCLEKRYLNSFFSGSSNSHKVIDKH